MNNLKLNLIVEALDRATAPLRAIGHGLEALTERTEKLHHTMHKLGLAEFVGGAFFTGALVEAGHKLVELTDHVAELGEGFLHASIKSGASVEAMQRLGFAAKQLGVDQDSLSQVFFRFQNHIADAIKGSKEARGALHLLGIPMRDLKKLSKDPEEAFMRLVDGFHAIHNPTLRAKLAMDLFSRSGYQIMPMLVAGREEIEKFAAQLDKAHAVMTKEQAQAAEEYIQKQHEMGLAVQGLQVQIGVRLIPAMTKAIDKLAEWIRHLQDGAMDRFTAALNKLIDKLPELLPRLEHAGEVALKLADALLELADNASLVKGVMQGLAVLLGAQLLISFVGLVGTVLRGIIAFAEFAKVVGSLIELSAGVRTFAGALALLDLAMDASPIGVLVLALGALLAAVAAVGVGVYLIYKHWDGLTAWFGNLWRGVEGVFAGAWKRLADLTPDWLKSLLKIGGAAIAISMPVLAPLEALADTLNRHAALGPSAETAAAGAPGQPGTPGEAGRAGEGGAAGQPGVPGRPGEPGRPGLPGRPGEAAKPGLPGRPGEAAKPGLPGRLGASAGPVRLAVPGQQPSESVASAAPTKPAQVQLHVTSDGQVKVKKVVASPDVDVSVHRGIMPDG